MGARSGVLFPMAVEEARSWALAGVCWLGVETGVVLGNAWIGLGDLVIRVISFV